MDYRHFTTSTNKNRNNNNNNNNNKYSNNNNNVCNKRRSTYSRLYIFLILLLLHTQETQSFLHNNTDLTETHNKLNNNTSLLEAAAGLDDYDASALAERLYAPSNIGASVNNETASVGEHSGEPLPFIGEYGLGFPCSSYRRSNHV